MHRLALFLPLVLTLAGSMAIAQDGDPPERVARLSYVQGEVSFEPEGSTDWNSAELNRPLTTGDKLWVDRESRAELQAGSARINVDQGTGISFINLDDNNLRLSLTDGTVSVEVRSLDRDENIEVETPNATVSLLRAGEYRISVQDDGNATVVGVRRGESEIAHDRQTFGLESGQQGRFSGTSYLNADVGAIGPRSDFEAWSFGPTTASKRSAFAPAGATREKAL